MGYIAAFLLALSLILGGTMLMDTRQDTAMTGALNVNTEAVVTVTNATQALIESQNSLRSDIDEIKTDMGEIKGEIVDMRSDIAALKQGQAVAGSGSAMPQIIIVSPGSPSSAPATTIEQATSNKPVLNLKPLR